MNGMFGIEFGRDADARNGSLQVQSSWAGLELAQTLNATFDASLKVTGGKALGWRLREPQFSVAVAKTHGQGKTIYLNTSVTEARQLITPILSWAGIPKRVELGGAFNGSTSFVSADTEYIGFMALESRDDVQLTFYRRSHLYDMRTRQYLGQTDTCRTDLEDARTKLYALLPYRVDGVALELDATGYSRGDVLTYQIRIKNSEQGAGNQCVRMQLFDSTGTACRWADRNVLSGAQQMQGTMQIPFNAAPGQWKITATEAVTGKTVDRKFTVE